MTKWNDQLSNHAIFTTLADLSERLKNEALMTEDIDVIELLDKVKQLVIYSEICLRDVMPELVSIGALNNANGQMTTVRNELNSYISNQNIAHLNNAASHVDATVAQLLMLPIPHPHLTEETFSESLLRFKSLALDSFQQVKQAKDQLDESVTDIAERSESQREDIELLAEKVRRHQSHIETQLTEHNERFKTYELRANEKLEAKLEEIDSEVSSALKSGGTAFDQQLKSHETSGSKIIEALELNKQQASDLVQVIGNIGITGNYQKIANQEKAAADKLRILALLLMISMFFIIAATILISATNGFDWKLALFRIGAALVLAIPATYAAKESSKHRMLENSNRRAELELASLDPFLEKLPEDTRFKVKEELTRKFFGGPIIATPDNERISVSVLEGLLEKVITKK